MDDIKSSDKYIIIRNTYKMRGNPADEEDGLCIWDYFDMDGPGLLSGHKSFYNVENNLISLCKQNGINNIKYVNPYHIVDLIKINLHEDHIYDIIFEFAYFGNVNDIFTIGNETLEYGKKQYDNINEALEHCKAVDFLFKNTDYENIFFQIVDKSDVCTSMLKIKEEAEKRATRQFVNSTAGGWVNIPEYLRKYL